MRPSQLIVVRGAVVPASSSGATASVTTTSGGKDTSLRPAGAPAIRPRSFALRELTLKTLGSYAIDNTLHGVPKGFEGPSLGRFPSPNQSTAVRVVRSQKRRVSTGAPRNRVSKGR